MILTSSSCYRPCRRATSQRASTRRARKLVLVAPPRNGRIPKKISLYGIIASHGTRRSPRLHGGRFAHRFSVPTPTRAAATFYSLGRRVIPPGPRGDWIFGARLFVSPTSARDVSRDNICDRVRDCRYVFFPPRASRAGWARGYNDTIVRGSRSRHLFDVVCGQKISNRCRRIKF